MIDLWHERSGRWLARVPWAYVLIAIVFAYTTIANMIERPDGLKIASWFILGHRDFFVQLADEGAAPNCGSKRSSSSTPNRGSCGTRSDSWSFPVLVPHRPGRRDLADKEADIRRRHRLADDVPIVFVEAEVGDPSEFQQSPLMQIKAEGERFIIRVERCVSVAHVLAALALELSQVGPPPEIHFGWSDENPIGAAIGFFLFGEGNVPWRVRELIRKAEPNPDRHPRVIIG